jgi:5-dehydro-2-deoxygluconokinase
MCATPESNAAFDVLTIGRVSVDLYPEQSGVPLAEVTTFRKSLGGGPTNVAVAAARLGHRSAVITKVGADGFGAYVRSALRRFGVDDRYVGTDEYLRTPIVFCELHPPDDFPLLFYRLPRAPDINITSDDLDLDAIRRARIFWTTGTGLSAEPSRSATLAALRARGQARFTVHDLDYRPSFWSSADEARRWQLEALSAASVVVGNRSEVELVVGAGSPHELAQRILDFGVELAFVKLGPDGALVARHDGVTQVDPVPVTVVNGLGAGDAFGGALCHGLLRGWTSHRILHFASAAGAYVAGQLACADAMPTEQQVNELLTMESIPDAR